MVAISVITIGILGIYSLVPNILSTSFENVDKFIAAQLAQEGVEIVRNIRDDNWLRGSSWNDGLTYCFEGCQIDYNDSSLSYYNDNDYLKMDSAGFYNYETGQNTKFKRKIIITQNGDDILNVKVQVSWSTSKPPFDIQENIYNWR